MCCWFSESALAGAGACGRLLSLENLCTGNCRRWAASVPHSLVVAASEDQFLMNGAKLNYAAAVRAVQDTIRASAGGNVSVTGRWCCVLFKYIGNLC